MTRKEGNALRPGIYKVHWKRGGWSWAATGEVHNRIKNGDLSKWLEAGMPSNFDRDMLAMNWSGALLASRMWRKIARVERAPLAKMEGER
jgi:hypothetical protein